MMDLKLFAKTYLQLEEKVYDIMKVYGLETYSLDEMDIDEYNGKTSIHIRTSKSYGSCSDSEGRYLTFDLEEMNNDIEYFVNKNKTELKEKEVAAKLIRDNRESDRKQRQDREDKIEYERLKKLFKPIELKKKKNFAYRNVL